MSLSSVLKRIPDIGQEFVQFVIRPRLHAKNWKAQTVPRVPSKEILVWCLAASFFLLALYKLAFGPMTDNVYKAAGLSPPSIGTDAPQRFPRPSLEHLGWQLGFSIGVAFPQAMTVPTSHPQLAVFSFGASQVVLSNVVPDSLLKTPVTTVLLGLYALLTILSLHLPARLLGGSGTVSEATRLAIIYYAFVTLLASSLIVTAAVLLIHVLRLHGCTIFIGWAIVVLLPLTVVLLRGFFSTFSEYYGLAKRRLFVAGLGSIVISSILGPIALLPTIYLVLWAAPLLDVIF
ncbi:MAG TPA: hypothetical protein VGS57_05950 [Thermoanaerobaculia bacterium]|nr:hypothetical protein [Thermoanaerobaculia bacterium]